MLGKLMAKGSRTRTYALGGTLVAAGVAVLAGIFDLNDEQVAGIAGIGTVMVSETIRFVASKFSLSSEALIGGKADAEEPKEGAE